MPRILPVIALGWVTAAIIASVAIPVMNIPPRNSHGSAPSGVTRWIVHVDRGQAEEPEQRDEVEQRPLVADRPPPQRHRSPDHRQRRPRGGSPLALENVFRYRASTLEMQRPAICQYASGVTSQLSIGPSWYSSAVDHGDGDGGEEHPAGDLRQPAPAEAHQADHDQRPDQVELLLHGEAPQVAQRGEVAGRRCSPGRPRSGTSSTRRPAPRSTSPRSWPSASSRKNVV